MNYKIENTIFQNSKAYENELPIFVARDSC